MKTGIELIAEERWEQTYKHNYGSDHDSQHEHGEIAKNAALLALWHTDANVTEQGEQLEDDWGLIKHIEGIEKTQMDRTIHCLKVAGALIAAEIDRLTTTDGDQKDLESKEEAGMKGTTTNEQT